MRIRRPLETQAAAAAPTGPRRIETSLLVVTDLVDARGREWRPGDRAPLSSRAVRQAALAQPDLFLVEHEATPVDLEWLAALDAHYDERYEAELERRANAKADAERALRAELDAQDRTDPRLEWQYRRQKKAREQREQDTKDAIERDRIEQELEAGFHFHP